MKQKQEELDSANQGSSFTFLMEGVLCPSFVEILLVRLFMVS